MKHFTLPLAVLVLLFSLSLINGRILRQNADLWIEDLERAQAASAQEDWEETAHLVETAYGHWLSRQTYLRAVCVQSDLNNAESLFRRCLILSRDKDTPEFHSNAAELIAQLHQLAQAEEGGIGNIL